MTSGGDTGHHIAPQNHTRQTSWCHWRHPVPLAAKQRQNIWLKGLRSFLWRPHFLICKHSDYVWRFERRCPPGSPPIASFLIQMVTDAVVPSVWRLARLCLGVRDSLATIWTILCCYLWCFCLPNTSRKVSYRLVDDIELSGNFRLCVYPPSHFWNPLWCSVVHDNTTQRDFFSIFCNLANSAPGTLSQMSLNRNCRNVTCLKHNYFLEFWQ